MTTASLIPRPAQEGTRPLTYPHPTADEVLAVSSLPTGLLCGRRWRLARSGRTLPVENPATGTVIAHVADSGVADAKDALGAAADAFPVWSHVAPRERAAILRRAADMLWADADRLAVLLTLEVGKPLREARQEVDDASAHLAWAAEEALRVDGGLMLAPDGSCRFLMERRPVGPCLVITPWNFPVAIAARGIAPALAAGCTVILRAPALAPLAALALVQTLQEAGLPAGALNVLVAGEATVTDPLLEDPRLRKVTFTGSTTVGREVIRTSARQVLRVTTELGGQNPFLVFDDADLDAAVTDAVIVKTRNAGQACTAANLFLVHERVADEFAHRLADRLSYVRLGDGLNPSSQMGPIASPHHRHRIQTLVQDALAHGAHLIQPGSRDETQGCFLRPAVLTGLDRDARVLNEEIFGPVAPVVAFGDDDEAVRLANRTDLGLAAYIHTGDLARAMRIGARIDAGMVAVNQSRVSFPAAPFGGVKQSGCGRSGGPDALDEYLETTYLAIPDDRRPHR